MSLKPQWLPLSLLPLLPISPLLKLLVSTTPRSFFFFYCSSCGSKLRSPHLQFERFYPMSHDFCTRHAFPLAYSLRRLAFGSPPLPLRNDTLNLSVKTIPHTSSQLLILTGSLPNRPQTPVCLGLSSHSHFCCCLQSALRFDEEG